MLRRLTHEARHDLSCRASLVSRSRGCTISAQNARLNVAISADLRPVWIAQRGKSSFEGKYGRNPIDRIPGITILPATLECHFYTQLGTGQPGTDWAADRIANRVSVHAVRRDERAQSICE